MGLATLRFVVGGDAAGAPRPPEPPRDPKKRRPPRSLAAELALVARSDAVRGYARSLDVRDAVFEASFEARNETRRLTGQDKRAKFQTSKPHISAVFHSFWLIFGRAIISWNGLDAWMLFPERARAEHSR